MTWWKKLFSKIQKEEPEEEGYPISQEDQADSHHEPAELKTRVIYQYPKGEFRFPLIKDNEFQQPEHTTRKKQRKEKQSFTSTQETKRPQTKQEAHSSPGKIEPKSTRPFTPTHIPSPVYGYQQPKRRRDSAVPREEEQVCSEGTFGEQPMISDADPQEQQKEKVESEIVAERVELNQLPHETEQDTNDLQPECIDHSNEDEEPEENLEMPCEESGMIVEEDSDTNAVSSETNEANDDQDIEEAFDFISDDEMEMLSEESYEPSAENNEASLPHFTEAAEEELSEPTIHSCNPKVEKKDVDSIDASVEKDVEESRAVDEEEPGRSHLPFNVLMLSQDRSKIRRKKEISPPEQRASFESEHSNEPAPEKKVRNLHDDRPAKRNSDLAPYELPSLSLLAPPVYKEENTEWLTEQSELLNETMENFNVSARVVKASQGPAVTRFEVQPDKGVKVNKVTNLSNDIKLSMAARDIRMEAPIPGTRSIGIELPNKESRPVQISEIIGQEAFRDSSSPLSAVLGLDISGAPVVTDLRKMPHGLIAGATGSGKSVCINSILISLLYKAKPHELKLMLIDPKMVELAPYNHIPHLVSPVITDVKAATAALKWAVEEMERRYELFVHAGVRDISRFNELANAREDKSETLSYIVIVIDELADLMMVAPSDVEESICRIAQKARACGIHLLIATQRPSVDVITGLIKANVPTRIAFAVSSQVDSRTVIDVSGAEKLLGRGDMLFLNNGSVKPVRLQGTFVSDEEIDRVIEHVRSQGKPDYLFEQAELLKKAEIQENEDELLIEACEFVIKQGSASTSLLQRHFKIGYNRAARLMEMMEAQGVISGSKGSKPRDVLMSESELDSLKEIHA